MAKKRKKRKAVRPGYSQKPARPGPAGAAAPPKAQNGLDKGFLQKRFGIICLVVIFIVGLLAYANTFEAAFVFDDFPNIVDNNSIRGIGSALTETLHSRVVGYLTFALNYKINGLDVTGYHVFNLAVHLTNALLVFWLVMLTLKTPFLSESRLGKSGPAALVIALFAALIFISHPVQTQAVTYLFQRMASLATLFYLLSVVMYARWRLSADDPETTGLFGHRITVDLPVKRAIIYIGSLGAALLAMGTKEIAITLPVVLALWEFSFFGGAIKRRLISLLPFALMLPLAPLGLKTSDMPLLSSPGVTSTPATSDYLFTQFRVIVTYLRLLVLPVGQNLDYDYPLYQSLFDVNVLLSLLFLLAIAGTGVILWFYAARGNSLAPLRLIAFGILWFFTTIAVESSVIPFAELIFEHRLYLPSVGLIVAVVAAVPAGCALLRKKAPRVGVVAIALGALVVFVLGASAFNRNRVWSDPGTLWADSARKSPGKARPHNNLGTYYYTSGQLDKVEAEFRRSIELKPDYAEAHNNLGVFYLNSTNQLDKAEAEFKRAIDLKPDFAEAHNNMGLVYKERGEYDRAIKEFTQAISSRPDYDKAHYNMGLVYEERGELDKASGQYELAVTYEPDFAEAHNNLGIVYGKRGEYDRAIKEYEQAIAYKPDFADAYFNLGLSYVKQERYSEAIGPFLKVAELSPGNFIVHNYLGNIYMTQGRYDKALAEYKAALKINPDYQEAKNNIQLLQSLQTGPGSGR